MLSNKKGASIISLALCFVAIACVTTALVVANNNSVNYKIAQSVKNTPKIVDSSAYVKVYTIEEVTEIARQAYVDNYLSLYDNEIDLVSFEALVLGEIANKIGLEQLENYAIYITEDNIDVLYK